MDKKAFIKFMTENEDLVILYLRMQRQEKKLEKALKEKEPLFKELKKGNNESISK